MFPGVLWHSWRSNLAKEVSLLWGGESSKPIDLSARCSCSHPLPWRISDTSLYMWEKWTWDCSQILVSASMNAERGQPRYMIMKDTERDYKICGPCARVEQNTMGTPWCRSLFLLASRSGKGQLQSSCHPSASHHAHSHPSTTYLVALGLIPTVFVFCCCTHCYGLASLPVW